MFNTELTAFIDQAQRIHNEDIRRERERLDEISILRQDLSRFREAAKTNIDNMFNELLSRIEAIEETQSALVRAMEPENG
jgi:tRNA A37 methylthiotransferase MiaB